MIVTKPVRGTIFINWFHSGWHSASSLECYSCECFWTAEDFKKVLRKRNSYGIIASDLDKPIGFLVCEKRRRKGEVEILNLVVHPDYRRKSIGTMLLDRLKKHSRPLDKITCNIRESNLSAHLFFKKNGFLASGVARNYFKDYYPEQDVELEDAFCFYYESEDERCLGI